MFNNLVISVDRSGCHHYRHAMPMWACQTMLRNVNFVETNKYVFDPKWYTGFTTISVQRHVSDFHAKVYLDFFKPLADSIGIWLIYSTDDAVFADDIPQWNMAKKSYSQPTFQENITKMISASNFIVVTTEELRDYYVERCNVSAESFIVIPNYMSRWWCESYNLAKTLENYNKFKKRPRVGFTSSCTHMDIMNQNNGVDDFEHINDFIRANTHKYEFCFIGSCPPRLIDLAQERKITVYPGSDILNYMREVHEKSFQVIVAPLQDNIFNRCKSNLKLLEGWALGIPVIGQDITTYNKYTDIVFNDANQLQNKLDYVLKDREHYKKLVIDNRKIVDFGSSNIPGLRYGAWLEKNLSSWIQLYTMPQRQLTIDLRNEQQNNLGVV
jgi:glycosyltransferase involved in cell wall biosynthesis